MRKCFYFFTLVFSLQAMAQSQAPLPIRVTDQLQQPVARATVELLSPTDSSLLKINLSDEKGEVYFGNAFQGNVLARISCTGYQAFILPLSLPLSVPASVVLSPAAQVLGTVTVAAKKPFIEMKAGKTIINLESGISTAGTTAMETLEKLPGISIDKDGNIALKGKTGVTVMIDGKPSYLDAAQLATLLQGISASQISQVEIIDQPGARYEAAGNAGLINIKTKKTKTKGFNGSISTAYSQGFYPKNNHNLQLNYRSGKWNVFAGYSVNLTKQFTRIYALRTYFQDDGTVLSLLEQPTFIRNHGSSHTLRAGADYFISNRTTAGIVFNGLVLDRNSNGQNTAQWLSPGHTADSLIVTGSHNTSHWKNAGANINFRHAFTPHRELGVDVDMLGYRIRGRQAFDNRLLNPGSYVEASRALLPSDIRILSAKTDYTEQVNKWKLSGGAKTSHVTTDNLAAYEYADGSSWKPDEGRSNHFLYTENIHALYTQAAWQKNKWDLSAGIRFEATGYDARQLGNSVVKDSSFSRQYQDLFPSASIRFAADSNHTFSISTGRRIDRPAFQKLNPFLFVINKYTYQKGNPFYKPQYTWNFSLDHAYKDILLTGITYSVTKDFFSQVFPLDSSGIVVYTEGNLEKLQQLGLSLSLHLAPARWWNVTAQATGTHKWMKGFIEKSYERNISQFSINMNNQFRFGKKWSAELTGYFNSRSQQDIQEIVDPAGQLSIGIARQVFHHKGTLKLAARDVLYTQWMKGMTYFPSATEYFKLTRDSRVLTCSFTYRFGKAFKATRRTQGASAEEIERVGNG